MYQHLAQYYDWVGALDISEALTETIVAQLQALAPEVLKHPTGSYVDLGCGTGTSTLALAESLPTTWQVVGIDSAPAMLKEAARKRDILSQPLPPIQWQLGDIRTWYGKTEPSFDAPVRLMTCLYDTLNHLLAEDDLAACFAQCVASFKAAPNPSGVFVFDLNTWENYELCWQGTDTDELSNAKLRFESQFDPQTHLAEATIHADIYPQAVVTGDEDESATDEESPEASVPMEHRQDSVQQRWYAPETVERLLMAAGFSRVVWVPLEIDWELFGCDAPLKHLGMAFI